jgi:hypothetical protein
MDYLVPTAADVPPVEAIILESGAVPGNPLGIKGAGEAGVQGVAAAIVNAVAEAVGASDGLRTIPMRPEHVLDSWPDADADAAPGGDGDPVPGEPAAGPTAASAVGPGDRLPSAGQRRWAALASICVGTAVGAVWFLRRRSRRQGT